MNNSSFSEDESLFISNLDILGGAEDDEQLAAQPGAQRPVPKVEVLTGRAEDSRPDWGTEP